MSLDERNGKLEEALQHNPIDQQIAALVRADKRRKWQVVLLAFMIAGLGFVSYKTSELAKLAQSNHEAVIANCETANDSRRNNKALWDFAFSLSPDQPRTPEQQARTDQFRAFVDKTFTIRNCQAEIEKNE